MDGCIYRTVDGKCEFWSDYGKGIVSYCDFEDCEEKKPSNADRIRSMTDEVLAEFESTIGCHPDARRETCLGVDRCAECWLDWLRQEAE